MMLVSEPSIGEAGTGEGSSPVGGDRRASTACRAQSEGTCGPQGHPLRRDLGGHSWQPPPQHAEGGTPCSLPTGCSCRGARGAHGARDRVLGGVEQRGRTLRDVDAAQAVLRSGAWEHGGRIRPSPGAGAASAPPCSPRERPRAVVGRGSCGGQHQGPRASGEADPGTGILPRLRGCLLPPRPPPGDGAMSPEGTRHPQNGCRRGQGCEPSPGTCGIGPFQVLGPRTLGVGRGHQAGRTVAGQGGDAGGLGKGECPSIPGGPWQSTGAWGGKDAADGSSIPQPVSWWQRGLSCLLASAGGRYPAGHRTKEPSPAQGTLLRCWRLSGVLTGHAASAKHPNTRSLGRGDWPVEWLQAVARGSLWLSVRQITCAWAGLGLCSSAFTAAAGPALPAAAGWQGLSQGFPCLEPCTCPSLPGTPLGQRV